MRIRPSAQSTPPTPPREETPAGATPARGLHSVFEEVGRALHHAKEELVALFHHQRGAEVLPCRGEGTLPEADLDGAISGLDSALAATPPALASNSELARPGAFVPGSAGLALSERSRAQVRALAPPFAQMFAATAAEVMKVASGALSPSAYMIAVMDHAATLTGAFLGSAQATPAQRNEIFARLVHFAFCAHAEDDSGRVLNSEDLKREAVGFGISDAGSLLEDAYRLAVATRCSTPGSDPAHPQIFGNGVRGGFNYNIVDRVSGGSTITHHFGEFLGAGFVDLLGQADRAVTIVDSPGENPADVRNGYFAVMVGQGLASGSLTPGRAIALTRFALTTGGPTPPWGTPPEGNDDGTFLSAADFELPRWQAALDAA
jgi:hypothetical protein